ncbi:MAG: sorbosone dehydrogenase family protein [Planctomycetota bacterium]
MHRRPTAALAAALILVAAPAAAQNLPLGFTVDVIAPGLNGPIGLAELPDGRIVFVEQATGAVKVIAGVAAGTVAVATIGTVPNLTVSYSQGLLAVAVDPAWPARPFVYVLHSDATGGDHRISRWTASGALGDPDSTNLQLAQPYVVLAGIPDALPVNDGGCLRFGPDGMLYATLGDDHQGCLSQDPTQLHGKLLRLDVAALPASGSGTAPRALLAAAGNPFAGPGDIAPLVWATGLRNPFRFHVDPLGGALFVTDVGEDQGDEVDRIAVPGANLGWPWVEADQPHTGCGGTAPATLAPIAVQSIGPGFTALVSMGLYRAAPGAPFAFGPGYEGSYFYTDHFTGRVWRIAADPSTDAWGPAPRQPGQPSAELWAQGLLWITDALVGRDGALWFCERQGQSVGSVRRVRPTGAAFAPFGQGCAGTAAPPVLQATGAPQLGATFQLTVTGLRPQEPWAVGMLGFARDRIGPAPLPLDLAVVGMPGCAGWIEPDRLELLAGAGGLAPWSLPIPLDPALSGFAIFAQALVADAGANAFGAVVTNGGEGVLR